jgi:hypothetical protein
MSDDDLLLSRSFRLAWAYDESGKARADNMEKGSLARNWPIFKGA